MGAYIHDQSILNERRMKEMEEQARAANEAALASSKHASASASASLTPATDLSTSTTAESTLSLDTPIVQPTEVLGQNSTVAT